MNPTVDVAGAAALLFVHEKTVLELIEIGALPAAKIGRAYVLMTRHVLDHLETRITAETAARTRSIKALPGDPAGANLSTRAKRRSRIAASRSVQTSPQT